MEEIKNINLSIVVAVKDESLHNLLLVSIAAGPTLKGQFWMASSLSADVKPSAFTRGLVLILFVSLASAVFVLQFFSTHAKQTRKRNRQSRNNLFKKLGLEVKNVPRQTILGFFHPYW